MKKIKTLELVLCALFAALSAILSQLSIPIGPVPINLTHVSIFVAAGLLGAKYGAVSQILFVLMGASGVPVFSGFNGGIGIVLGPRGGFIIGYIGCAFVTGLIIDHFGKSIKALTAAMYAGWIVTYTLGVSWYMYITHTGFIAALLVCVLPFLAGDIPKTILSSMLVNRLHPVLQNYTAQKHKAA